MKHKATLLNDKPLIEYIKCVYFEILKKNGIINLKTQRFVNFLYSNDFIAI